MATSSQAKSKAKTFTFKVGTKTYSLPLASKGKAALTGRDLRDALLGGDGGEFAYLIKALEAADPNQASLDALYSLKQDRMIAVLSDWAAFGDGDGASLGESTA